MLPSHYQYISHSSHHRLQKTRRRINTIFNQCWFSLSVTLHSSSFPTIPLGLGLRCQTGPIQGRLSMWSNRQKCSYLVLQKLDFDIGNVGFAEARPLINSKWPCGLRSLSESLTWRFQVPSKYEWVVWEVLLTREPKLSRGEWNKVCAPNIFGNTYCLRTKIWCHWPLVKRNLLQIKR